MEGRGEREGRVQQPRCNSGTKGEGVTKRDEQSECNEQAKEGEA